MRLPCPGSRNPNVLLGLRASEPRCDSVGQVLGPRCKFSDLQQLSVRRIRRARYGRPSGPAAVIQRTGGMVPRFAAGGQGNVRARACGLARGYGRLKEKGLRLGNADQERVFAPVAGSAGASSSVRPAGRSSLAPGWVAAWISLSLRIETRV